MRITQGWPNAQDLNLGDGRRRLVGSERENTGASAQSQFIQSTGGFSALVVVGVCTLVLFLVLSLFGYYHQPKDALYSGCGSEDAGGCEGRRWRGLELSPE